MEPHNEEQTEAWMCQRRQQLRNQLEEVSGGMAMFGCGATDGLPLEVEIKFLEHVLSFELAETTTWKRILAEQGYSMPAPETLSDEEMSVEVWEVIQRLGDLQCYLDFTDHLSDQELYKKLYERLDEPTEDIRMIPQGSACHLEMLLSGEEEDDLIWLKYFADEKTRQMWHQEFNFQLPAHREAPYDRDHLLPHPPWPGTE
ncbi:hypothetical protein P0Y35_03370 [Kiritimatiellaeota bacterium B1221]|nr:hypothetical protein [Kiritimatiellaeota bacterium B1221]